MTSCQYVHVMNEFLFPHDIDFATVSCSQDVVTTPTDRQSPEHFKVCVKTSYNFSLLRYFLAQSVDP